MAIRGWVYVISNKAMPNLLKVGYSRKDPQLRAKELDHTGSPHPYIVEYDVLVIDPYIVEQRVHTELGFRAEGKEWFRCSVPEAIICIRNITGNDAMLENIRDSPSYSSGAIIEDGGTAQAECSSDPEGPATSYSVPKDPSTRKARFNNARALLRQELKERKNNL